MSMKADSVAPGAAISPDDANFRALLDAAVDAIIMIDDSGRMLAFNDDAERIFGYREPEVLGRDVAILMPEPYRSAHGEYLSRYLRTGERRIIGIGREVEAVSSDGRVFPIELSVGQVDTDGAPRFVGFVRDVSARKRAEAETQDLQERLARVGRFSTMGEMAAGLAHEINQPLAAITSYAQAAERMASRLQNDDALAFADVCRKIGEQALRAGEVIRRLRGFLRVQECGREAQDLNALVREILMLAELDARGRDVPLEVQLADDLPPISGNSVEIQQVMLNLVRNAVDAMAEAGRGAPGVTVRTAAITADAEPLVEFSVTDRGPGLDPTVADQVFHPFVTTKEGGLGVGLSISRTIIQSHGGRLTHAPNPEGGAVFSFVLPASYEDRNT